jgi:AraC-like DNA-binding protein
VREVLKDTEGRLGGAPGFKAPFHYDPAIALGLRRLWYLLERNASDLEIEVKLHEVLPRVFTRYGGWEDRVAKIAPATLARVRDYIHAYLDQAIQLQDLASVAGISKRSLITSFSCHFGLPPQRYLIQARVNEARTLLRRGVEIAEVASAVGFADQSHLTRHFRSMLGVTPARYIRR